MLTTEQRLREIIADHLGIDPKDVKPESDIRSDLGADSLDVIEIVMAAEDAFHIEINDEDAENLDTFQSVVDYVTSQIHRQHP